VYGGEPRATPLVLSASKSQVGHTTSAAGLIALVRAALALDRRTLPPSSATRELDPELGLAGIPATLATEARPWTTPDGRPRRAAVSTFGMAGVNHHLVIEEAPGVSAPSPVAAPPGDGLAADRFVLELAPVALPERPPRFSLAGRRALVVGDPAGPAAAVARALTARGAAATVVAPGALDRAGAAAAEADVFLDLSQFGPSTALDAGAAALAAAARAVATRSFELVRAAYERLGASTAERPASPASARARGRAGTRRGRCRRRGRRGPDRRRAR